MFTFGEKLFNLTARDRQTLRIDPFIKPNNLTITIATNSNSKQLSVPIDRCLYLNRVVLTWANTAAHFLTTAEITAFADPLLNFSLGRLFSRVGSVRGIVGDSVGGNAIVAESYAISERMDIVLPPATQLQLAVSANAAVASNLTTSWTVWGYLLPAGSIGRAG